MAEPGTDAPAAGARPRRGMPAGDGLTVMLVCLLAWTLLYAPELVRAAESHPAGVRRDISLALLSPIAWVSDLVGLDAVTEAAARSAGRDPDAQIGGVVGGVEVSVDDVPTFDPRPGQTDPGGSPKPTKPPAPPVRDTDLRSPTGDQPLRVVVVGDSLAVGIGYFAERVFRPFFVDVVKQGRISTGLARPDYFSWPGQMRSIVDRYRPDLTIVMIGENDDQHLQAYDGSIVAQVGSGDWTPAYERRAREFAEIATSRKGHVMWVGLPIVRDTNRWPAALRVNDVYEAVAARLPNVGYVDTWSLLSKDGQYTAYYRDEGQVKLIREGDGIHFTSEGYTILMEQVARAAEVEFALDPRTYEA